jgi:phospholipid/cholesterol/gamma-HCH transport system substrate-binding protein
VRNIVTPLSVGILTCIALGFLIWGVVRVKKGLPPGVGAYRVHAMFTDASGIGARTRVVLAGVNVGQVEAIELVGDRAKVILSIRDDARLFQDASILKKQASVLGDYYLELIPGTLPPLLRDGEEIRNVRQEVGLGGILHQLSGVTGTIEHIARDIQKVTHRVADVFGTERGAGRMREILDSTAQIARKINEAILQTTGKLNRILDNFGRFSGSLNRFTDDTTSRVRDILGQVRDIAGEVRGIVGRSGDSLKTNFGQVKNTLESVQSAVDAVNRSLGHIENITRRVDEGKGLIGQLTSEKSGTIVEKSERLVDRAGDVAESIGDVVSGVGDFLDPLLRLQPIFDLHTEISALSGKLKNYVGLRLQPRPDKYYLIELVDDPRGKTSFQKIIRRTTSSRADPVVSEETTITENKLKFSLMLAKQFFSSAANFGITGRFGLKESTGGIGIDLHFPLRFEVQLDLFDFIGDDRPRFKTWALWQFARPFYLAAGADDLLNPASRDFFVSLGLRFTDEDLKSLLLVAPRPSP